MCLGVPMRIMEINGYNARCEARGIERNASLFLLQHEDLQVGDLVMIHVGNAIQKMTEEDAKSAWDLYDEIFEAENAVVGADLAVGAGLAGDSVATGEARDHLSKDGQLNESPARPAPTVPPAPGTKSDA